MPLVIRNGWPYDVATGALAVYVVGVSNPVQPPDPPEPPDPPTQYPAIQNLRVEAYDAGVTLSWPAVTFEYTVYRIWKNGQVVDTTAVTSYTATAQANNVAASWSVTAVPSDGSPETSQSNVVVATPRVALDDPVGLAIVGTPALDPSDSNYGLVNLSWTANAQAESTRVYYSDTSGALDQNWLIYATVTGTTSQNVIPADGRQRWYIIEHVRGAEVVRALASVGPASVAKPENPVTIAAGTWDTAYSPAGLVSAVAEGSTATVSLDWNALSENLTAYEVLRSTTLAGTYTVVATRAVPGTDGSPSRATLTGQALETNYYYKFRGVNGAVIGALSPALGPVLVSANALPTYEQRWGNANDPINKLIPASPSVHPSNSSLVSSLIQNINTTSAGKPNEYDNQQVPPIFVAPTAAGVDGSGNNWQWYTLISSYLGAESGKMLVLCHSGVNPAGDSDDNPLLIMCPNHAPPTGPALGERVYFRMWETGDGSPGGVNHTAKTITATGITPMYYGNRGTGHSTTFSGPTGTNGNVLAQAGNYALGWGRGWQGIMRRGDLERGKIAHSLLFVMKAGWIPTTEGFGGDFYAPAHKTDQGGDAGSGTGSIRMGMLVQLDPGQWPNSELRKLQIANPVTYIYTHAMVNGGAPTTTTSNTKYDRGPGSGNTMPWPADGGPRLTHAEVLILQAEAARDFGIYFTDGGGTSIGIRIEHKNTAKLHDASVGVVQGGEIPAGFGLGQLLRNSLVIPSATAYQGFPWGSVRFLAGSKTTLPKG